MIPYSAVKPSSFDRNRPAIAPTGASPVSKTSFVSNQFEGNTRLRRFRWTILSMTKKKSGIRWLHKPEKRDYIAAEHYLSLLFDEATAARYAKKLRRADVVKFEAKDVLRASSLPPLSASNPHVKQDRQRIGKGTPLAPILLVRDAANAKLIIADGYHRLCAAYFVDEDATIPCCLE
jgi:hypothetical protein